MKKLLIFPVGLFLFAVFFAFNVKAESIVPDGIEHVDSFDVVGSVASDSTFLVTETIKYNFGNQTKTGFTRYVPLNYQDLNGNNISINLSDVTVTDENGNQNVFSQARIQSDDKKKTYQAITIGDEKQQVSGTKIYVIKYTVSGAIRFKADHDELFWNATGDKWSVYVKYPEVKINLPQKVTSDKISKECFIGIHAATVECIDRLGSKKDIVADYSYKGVVTGEGMTTIISFPKGLVREKITVQQTFWSILKTDMRMQESLLLAVSALAALIFFVVIYYKKIIEFLAWKNLSKTLKVMGKKIKLHHVHAHAKKLKNKSRKWWITAGVTLGILSLSGFAVFWKIENTLNKISTKGESVGSIVQASLDTQAQIKGESEGRINILLLGILGANHPGGGLNTDTIMVVSIEPKENRMSLVSIPRDLWILDPGKDTKSKINAVYAYGEEKGPGQGIEDMEKKIGEISGLTIDYTAVVSTDGFAKLVDTFGGVDVTLTKAFDESVQFVDTSVCDTDTYTVPTGEFQFKKNKKGVVTAQYPLCKNSNPECGGDFHLPAGKNNLSGQQALCFARSRYLTTDFERAKRQQLIIQQLKLKINQLGITDFGKMNSVLDNLGGAVQTDMQLWEMRRLFDLYKGIDNQKIYQRVLEESKDGLLYSPDKTPETGYILLPIGDNYDKIKDLFRNIFTTVNQSDIKPKI